MREFRISLDEVLISVHSSRAKTFTNIELETPEKGTGLRLLPAPVENLASFNRFIFKDKITNLTDFRDDHSSLIFYEIKGLIIVPSGVPSKLEQFETCVFFQPCRSFQDRSYLVAIHHQTL